MESYSKTTNVPYAGFRVTGEGYYTAGPQPGYRVEESPYNYQGQGGVLTSSLNGYKNPNWKEQVRRTVQAGTPATGVYKTFVQKGYAQTWNYVPFRTGSGYYGPQERWRTMHNLTPYQTLGGTAGSLSEANNRALTKLYQRIDQLTVGLQGLVAAGEMAETLRMMRAPTRSLVQGIYRYLDDVKRQVKAMKRGRRISRQHLITRVHGVLAGLWLEHSFGWTPLVSDIESAADSLVLATDGSFIAPVVVRSQAESVGSPSYVFSSWSGVGFPSGAGAWYRRTRSVSVRYIACVAVEPRDSRGVALESFGVTAKQFVPAIWELIPYSFLIDYFTNIGDIVAGFGTNTRRIKWIVKTTKSEGIVELESVVPGRLTSQPDEVARVTARPTAVFRNGSFTRELPVALDLPSLEFSVPGLGSRKWINVLALVRSSRSVERLIARSIT